MREIISCGRLRIADLELHRNRGMELTYLTRGRLEWVVDGRIQVVQQGDLFFTLPWQLHGSLILQQPENEALHLLFRLRGPYQTPQAQLRFPSALGLSVAESACMSRRLIGTKQHAWPASARMKQLFPWLVEEAERTHPLSRANTISLLRLTLIELSQMVEQVHRRESEPLSSERRVEAFLLELHRTCGEEWTLEKMAEACGVHRTRFTDLVRKRTAYSPMTYLMRLRIDRARDLLREPEDSITDIALACGFNSSQYFANCFRKQVGLSPRMYREKFPELYRLNVDTDAIPWRSLEEERARVRQFRI